MTPMLLAAALLTALSSALALYAGSAHCRLPALRWLHRAGNWSGLALAVVSLALWIAGLGVGAGISVMLGSWMLAMMVIPYLAAFAGADRDPAARGRERG